MTALGVALAVVAACSLVLSVRSTSHVSRRLELIAPIAKPARGRWRPIADLDLRQAGLAVGADQVLALKIACGLGAALVSAILTLIVPIGPGLVLVAAYAGFVTPSMILARRAARRRAEAERATGVLVERLEALVWAGRPPETALALLVAHPTGSALLDATLRRASDAYALGAPLFRTLEAHAREDGLATCAAVAEDLGRARDLGAGSLGVIRERRATLRARERARSIEAASQVEGKLMLVLVLCYLPALLVLVVIPLFIGLMEGLFS